MGRAVLAGRSAYRGNGPNQGNGHAAVHAARAGPAAAGAVPGNGGLRRGDGAALRAVARAFGFGRAREENLRRLGREIERTRRRVGALEHVLIPNLEQAQRRIRTAAGGKRQGQQHAAAEGQGSGIAERAQAVKKTSPWGLVFFHSSAQRLLHRRLLARTAGIRPGAR